MTDELKNSRPEQDGDLREMMREMMREARAFLLEERRLRVEADMEERRLRVEAEKARVETEKRRDAELAEIKRQTAEAEKARVEAEKAREKVRVEAEKARVEAEKRLDEELAEIKRQTAEADKRHKAELAEADKRSKAEIDEIKKRTAEIEEQTAEIEKRTIAARERHDAEFAKLRAKTEESMEKLNRTVDGIGKRTGDFMENTGRILENGVLEQMKLGGGIGAVKGKVLGPLNGEGEYDAVVVNGKQTLVMEIKRNLKLTDVRDFLDRRLPRFVEEFPDLTKGRQVYGALAFELDADKGQAKELARENGLMLVQVSERKGMKILNPDPAKLRPIA